MDLGDKGLNASSLDQPSEPEEGISAALSLYIPHLQKEPWFFSGLFASAGKSVVHGPEA